MNKLIQPSVISEIRKLYETNQTARRFLDWAAARLKDSAETSVERAASVTQLPYGEMLSLFKRFEELGLGDIKRGRKGYKTRICWEYSLRSIGKAGKSEIEKLAAIDVNELDLPEEQSDQTVEDEDHFAEEFIEHSFQLRPNLTVVLNLPPDLSARDAERLASWVRTLPFE